MTAPVPALPPGACLLHIGPYKTGSSSIQAAMHRSRAALREHGVLYPGTGSRAMRAGWAVIGVTPRGRPPARIEEWQQLVDEVGAHPEVRVCVSTEDLGRVGQRIAHRVVEDLGPERLHVLTVVRRLDRLLPSQWQQRAQSFKTDSYDDYLHAVLDADAPTDHPAHQAFWASHDVARLTACWSAEVGGDRVVAVVADEGDRGLLPRTFEQLLGVPDGLLQGGGHSNPSLSYNSVELLRRLNEMAVERSWPDALYYRLMRSMVDAMKRQGRSPLDDAVPPLPPWAVARVTELSAARAEAVQASGVRVVGDVDTLREVAPAREAATGMVETISIDSVVQGLAGAVAAYERLRGQDPRPPSPVTADPDGGDRAAGTVAATPSRELLATAARRGVRRLRAGTRRPGGPGRADGGHGA
jgi:hypothetical protein